MKAFVVAGTHSGVGKTTVSIGLMAEFRRQGFAVQPLSLTLSKVSWVYLMGPKEERAAQQKSQNCLICL